MAFYDDSRNEMHLFIYAIGGRSSSTALQRILNSSNEVCIWGEAWGLDQLFLKFIHEIQVKYEDLEARHPKDHLKMLESSFATGVHDKFYPNAFREIGGAVKAIENVFTELIKPVGNIRRTGYKEVRMSSSIILETLLRMFPRCKILFLFRDPLKQWVSIRDSGWFGFSNDLDKFLSEYNRIADIYLNFHDRFSENSLIIENTQLYAENEMNRLIQLVELSTYDSGLINKVVSSINRAPLSDDEIQRISESALKKYAILRENIF